MKIKAHDTLYSSVVQGITLACVTSVIGEGGGGGGGEGGRGRKCDKKKRCLGGGGGGGNNYRKELLRLISAVKTQHLKCFNYLFQAMLKYQRTFSMCQLGNTLQNILPVTLSSFLSHKKNLMPSLV